MLCWPNPPLCFINGTVLAVKMFSKTRVLLYNFMEQCHTWPCSADSAAVLPALLFSGKHRQGFADGVSTATPQWKERAHPPVLQGNEGGMCIPKDHCRSLVLQTRDCRPPALGGLAQPLHVWSARWKQAFVKRKRLKRKQYTLALRALQQEKF